MGKHERGEIEKAEKIIVKMLNNKRINEEDKNNYWFKHITVLVEKIRKDFPSIDKAVHLGNRYDNMGDILIQENENNFFIEIKMSYSKKGIGTQANLSQDALTLNNLFEKFTLSWSSFRRKLNHDQWVNKILNQFKNYPQKILQIKNKIVQKEEKARYLRKIKKYNKEAACLLSLIHEKDRKEKIKYLRYLSQKKQNSDNIKKFIIGIFLGIHKQRLLKDFPIRDLNSKEMEKFFVYYSNCFKNKIIVKKENVGEKIKLINNFSNFKIIFPKNVTHCRIIRVKNNKKIPFLEIVFHWKNIAQGIKTPCLNVFRLIN